MRKRASLTMVLFLATTTLTQAGDWPTFRHDNHRSGRTTEQVAAATLRKAWVWRSPGPPQPACSKKHVSLGKEAE